jgi:hypothetical protein
VENNSIKVVAYSDRAIMVRVIGGRNCLIGHADNQERNQKYSYSLSHNVYAQMFRDSGIFWGILLNFQSSSSTSQIPFGLIPLEPEPGPSRYRPILQP